MDYILNKFNGEKEREILNACKKGSEKMNGLYTFVNPYSYSQLKKNIGLCQHFDQMFSDGILMTILYNLFTRSKISRLSFDMSSLAPYIFNYSIKTNSTIAFIGSSKDDIENFINIIKTNFPRLNIVYYRNGFFSNYEEYFSVVTELNSLNPEILIAGLGTPLQERFLVSLKEAGWLGLGFTCGGFMSQTQGKLNFYPAWIDKLHMRWVYRIAYEPHTRKRFLKTYLIFPFIFLKDLINRDLNRNKLSNV